MLKYFSVYDRVNNSYSRLMAAPSERGLYRDLLDKTPVDFSWRKHPGDFSIVHVLDMDDDCNILGSTPSKPVTILSSLTMVFDPSFPNQSEVDNG